MEHGHGGDASQGQDHHHNADVAQDWYRTHAANNVTVEHQPQTRNTNCTINTSLDYQGVQLPIYSSVEPFFHEDDEGFSLISHNEDPSDHDMDTETEQEDGQVGSPASSPDSPPFRISDSPVSHVLEPVQGA